MFGSIALKAITKSNGILIGKGVAIAGIVLGTLSLLVWSFIIFGNLVYTIGPGEEAIVFSGNKQNHIIKPGVHLLTPGIERVKIYDLSKIYSNNIGTQKYLLFNNEAVHLNVKVKWRICKPAEHADNFLGLDDGIGNEALSRVTVGAIRDVLYIEKVTDPIEMQNAKIYNAVRKKFEERAKALGICLANDLNNDKAIRFAIMVN